MFVVGNFGYGGNQYAAEILREELHLNGIQLQMCHEYPNADWHYTKERIFEFIDSCDAIILPGRTKIQSCKSVNRLAMAWSRTKPVVIPPLDSYLRYATNLENCVVANSQEEFVRACVMLKNDEEFRNKIAANGHSVAQQNLHPRNYIDRFLEAIRETGAGVPWRSETFVQIIIPHYSTRKDYLRLAVESAVETWGPSRDVLVVSSSAIDPTPSLQDLDCRVYHSDTRLSFSQANNVGIGLCDERTTHVLLLNDDTIMSKRALGGYIEAIGDRKVILNPYSNCDQTWLHNDVLELSTGKPIHPNMTIEEFTPEDFAAVKEYEGVKGDNPTELIRAPFAAFYGTMIPKDVVDRIGKLNSEFLNGGEDADYCYRARALLGVESYWTRNAFVYHFGGKTRKFSEEQNYEQHHLEDQFNNSLLRKKWPANKKKVGIWCGPGWEKWDLDSYRKGGSGLGGSETCAGKLAETMVKDGHHVVLYGDLTETKEQYGVLMVPWTDFKPEEEYFDLFIASRNLNCVTPELKAKRIVAWCHDIFYLSGQHVSDFHRTVVDKFIALTPWHKEFVMGHHALPEEKIEVIPNGVNVEMFQ